ncbi:MAG: hypothetical protein A2452_13480 [Candidatus Firestonebacteria bacterium RIFOXYC2_FULL_39_67]|nr:MAG: hypothetical protein A2452_13480 [Candidatus Firestonebacteria bacterium RIFOXYC2_FULL_39_67]OGF57297.1 MAG: hypothetical protein A2497_03710 [Candidatus Firestonebacteria bacterium RifOxyC12_full_39_7]
MKIDHVGYLTLDIEKTFSVFKKLGWKKRKSCFDSLQKLSIQFITKDNVVLELIQPRAKSIISESYKNKYSDSMYHVAYLVDSIDDTIKSLKKKDVKIVKMCNKIKSKAFKGSNIIFLMTSIGVIELVESK